METNAPRATKESPDFAIGSIVFDNFEILDYISSGAMGRVLKARAISLNTIVALKVLVKEASSDRALMRFQSEARVASKLKHPNIATIYDFGLFGTTPYLSMEFVDGESLKDRLDREKTLLLIDCLEFIQVNEALVYAHSMGIIHRDIKPGNVVVNERKDGSITAKILDSASRKSFKSIIPRTRVN